MTIRFTALVGALLILLITFELLRRRQLREKYAALWLVVSVCGFIFAAAPSIMTSASEFLGFSLPVNLFFCLVGALLLLISMQFSLEMGRLEEENRRLAEELTLQSLEISQLQQRLTQLEAQQPSPRKPAGD